MRWLNDIHRVGFHRISRFVFRYQCLVQFLACPDSDVLDLTTRSHCLSQVGQAHTGNLGDENFAAVHLLNATNDKLHTLLECDPEPSHSGIGDGELAASFLLEKHWDHASAASDHVAVSRTTKARISRPRVCICLHEHLLCAQFGCAIKIDRVHGLVGTQRQYPFHALVDRGVDHIAAAHDVGLDRFERVVLTRRNLFQRCRMNNHRHACQGAIESIGISDITDEIPQTRMVETGSLHFVLLQLVAAEDHESFRLKVSQHDFNEFLAE